MKFRVYFKHMDSSLSLLAYAEAKVGDRIEKYALPMTDAHMTFNVEHGTNQAACHLEGPGVGSLQVEADDDLSMYAAVDLLADKLDACLRRRKGKVQSHRASCDGTAPALAEASGRAEDGWNEEDDDYMQAAWI